MVFQANVAKGLNIDNKLTTTDFILFGIYLYWLQNEKLLYRFWWSQWNSEAESFISGLWSLVEVFLGGYTAVNLIIVINAKFDIFYSSF